MSLNTSKTIKCPACGQISEITLWDSITAVDSPDLKSDLLSGKINMFYCPSCSHFGLVPEPMLYHDEDQKLLISFSPSDNEDMQKRMYKEICEASKTSGELETYEGYNLRFVWEYNALLEKILIFDAGLNDKAIEVIKLLILSQEPELQDSRRCIFGKNENGAMEFIVHDTSDNKVYTSSVPESTYNTVWQQLKISGVKPYSFNWEIVDSSYAAKLMNGFYN